METNKIYQKIKRSLITVGLTYCILGNFYGIAEHLTGNTTGHVSSDIYLRKQEPTKLEKAVIGFFSSTTSPDSSVEH